MTENVRFRPLSEKVFTQSNSNMVCTHIGWVFKMDSLLGDIGQILALWWPKDDWKWRFATIIWKCIRAIQFKLGLYTYWVSVQNWLAFGPCWPNFGPLVATKWLKMEVLNHYLKKYSCNPIQTWSVHLSGKSSELIHFWAMLTKFWPSSSQKMTENVDFRPLFETLSTQSNSNLVCTLTGRVFRIVSLLGHVGQILAL